MKASKRQPVNTVDVAERASANWQKEGLPVAAYADKNGPASEYDTAVVIRWLLQQEPERLNKEKLRGRLDRVKTELAGLEWDEKLGQLASVAMFKRIWDSHILTA